MDAIHSLQLIIRNSCKESEAMDTDSKAIHTRLTDLRTVGIQELEAVTFEMVRLIETANFPILAVNIDGQVTGWNRKIADLTHLPVDKAIGWHLLELVEEGSADTVSKTLELALEGREERKVQFEIKSYGSNSESYPITLVVNACSSRDVREKAVGVCFIARDITAQKDIIDKFTRIEGDYRSIVQNPNPLIPPIFGTDEFRWCSEWNPAMVKVSGWTRDDMINKMLMGEVFGTQKSCNHVKNQETHINLGIVLNSAVSGGKYVECLLSVSKKLDREGAVTRVCCFLQLASQELQQALHVQQLSEQTALKRSRVWIIF